MGNDLALVQGTEEWLNMRRRYIGASNAAAIMGIDPWSTAYDVWLDKLGFGKPKYESPAMIRGRELEPVARQAFIEKTGIVMVPEVVFSPEHDFLMASLDGIDFDRTAICEIKCPTSESVHQRALDGEIPEYYKPQLLHQMVVTGIRKAYYFSYTPTSSALLEYEYNPNDAFELVEKEREFWSLVQTLEPPKLSDKDYQIRVDDEWVTKANALKEVVAYRKAYEREEEQLREEMISLAQDRNCKGGGISVLKVVKKGSVNYKLAAQSAKIDLEPYTKKESSTYWRIS